ncbi:MAG: CHASE2 domain-containing protein, partial [Desulfobacterales bacterium]
MFKNIFSASHTWCVIFAVLLLGSMMLNIYPLQSLEYKAYDIMARLRLQQAGKAVVIVAIDEKSIKDFGGWPWPRAVIAQMIWRLTGYGAQTLGINLLYSTVEVNAGLEEIQKIRSSLPKKLVRAKKRPLKDTLKALRQAENRLNLDYQLSAAVKKARNVVLPLRFVIDPAESEPTTKASEWLRLNSVDLLGRHGNRKGFGIPSEIVPGHLKTASITASSVFQPFSELSTKAGGMGHINLIPDNDNVVRKIPLIIRYQQRDFLSFALLVGAKHFFNMPREDFDKDLKPSEIGLQLRHLQIPTEYNYQMYIDYGNQNENIRKYSFSEVFNGNIPAEAFRNKVVLIGVTARGLSPNYKIASHSSLSEIEILASAIENLINQRYISRPPWSMATEALVLLYFLFFLVLVIPKVNQRTGMLILGVFLITWVGTIGLIFLKYGYWLQVTAPILLSIVGFGLARHHRLSSEKQKEQIELNKSL